MEEDLTRRSSGARQMLGSLVAAALIVVLAIWAVTARLGPTSIAEREAAEEGEEEAGEAAEEAEEASEEAEEKADGEGGRRRRRGRR